MVKAFWVSSLVAVAVVVATNPVQAQTGGSTENKPTGVLNEDYLTSTGQTVPRPGVPQGAPTSDLDRRIEKQNNRIDNSICSNCN